METKKSFETGLKKTIKWYIDNEKWWRDIQHNKYDQERLGLKKLKVKMILINLLYLATDKVIWNLENRFTGWTDVDINKKRAN